MSTRPTPSRTLTICFIGLLGCAGLAHARSIAWGEPGDDGVRIGLLAPRAEIAEGAKFLLVEICYQNAGDKPAEVPVHADARVNSSRLMFKGESGGRGFTVGYFMTRLATALPISRTLQPGATFCERLILHVGELGTGLGYFGLPAIAKRDSLSLQVGLCAGIDPHRDKDWEGALKSGKIALTGTADPTGELLTKFKQDLGSFRLRLEHHGDKTGGAASPDLMLHVAGLSFQPRPNWDSAQLKPDEARKVLEGLAADGFFRQASAGEATFAAVGYVLHLETDHTARYEILGKPDHLRMYRPKAGDDPDAPAQVAGANSAELISARLTALNRLLEGDGKMSFGRFLAKLTGG